MRQTCKIVPLATQRASPVISVLMRKAGRAVVKLGKIDLECDECTRKCFTAGAMRNALRQLLRCALRRTSYESNTVKVAVSYSWLYSRLYRLTGFKSTATR